MRDKNQIREAVWSALEQAGVVLGGSVHDKIPDFVGAEAAAQRVFALDCWRRARVVKSNPDRAQRPLRRRALEEGKLLYMAVPRLEQERCFVELDPARLQASGEEASTLGLTASTIEGAFRHGRLVKVAEMRPVDLIISGSVAVNRQGVRIGKGGGFADLEYGLAAAAGVVTPATPVLTTVHPMQVLEEDLPWTRHDVPLDYLVTPDEVVPCASSRPRPKGIYWDDLDEAKVAQIPVLQQMRLERPQVRSRGGQP
ncbi:MAG TPA: 5-formyltetrahydrofolate cyclo-ligase [Dehalococcoidia bacterium]|nr:5-formyltetrahydrofolate cyclo-ligase [Dehalococcoidia bacterium]